MLAKLSYELHDAHEQPEPEAGCEEEKEARDKVEQAVEEQGNDLDSLEDTKSD